MNIAQLTDVQISQKIDEIILKTNEEIYKFEDRYFPIKKNKQQQGYDSSLKSDYENKYSDEEWRAIESAEREIGYKGGFSTLEEKENYNIEISNRRTVLLSDYEEFKRFYETISYEKFKIKIKQGLSDFEDLWEKENNNNKLTTDTSDRLNFRKYFLELINFQKTNAFTQPKKVTDLRTPVKVIGLKHYYEGIQITRENCQTYAEQYGWVSPSSGEGLFQDYTHYCASENRKAKPETPKKLENKIVLFKKALEVVEEVNKDKVQADINKLEGYLSEF